MAIGLLGGTFNPIHLGHLRGAIEAREALGLERVVLLPAGEPPLKQLPSVSALQRAEMVELAIAACPTLGLDRRELDRNGASYTFDTLNEWRQELGPEASLTFILGTDAALSLPRWHRWQELLTIAHLAILVRPGVEPVWPLPLQQLINERLQPCAALSASPHGAIAMLEQPLLAVSSTEIRSAISAGRDVSFLLPQGVLEYIETQGLYQRDSLTARKNC